MRPYFESDRTPNGPRLLSRGSFVKLLLGATAASGLALADRPREAIAAVAHPRLIANAADFAALKSRILQDLALTADKNKLLSKADAYVGASLPPTSWGGSHDEPFLERMFTCGAAHRLYGTSTLTKYGNRCAKELLHMANNVSNWAPDQWLTMGSTAAGMAIGYDYAYDMLTSSQRSTVLAKIKSKCFDPFLARREDDPHLYNWNIITNCGIGMLALAVEGDITYATTLNGVFARVDKLLGEGGFANLDKADSYKQNIINIDGGYKEGPSYWAFAMVLATEFLASWLTAKGTHSHWMTDVPGLRRTVEFGYHATGPTGKLFNFSDGVESSWKRRESHMAGWYGKHFDNEVYKWIHKDGWRQEPPSVVNGRFAFLSMLWKDGDGISPKAAGYPLDARFRRTDVVSMRSAWEDPQALYVASRVGGDVDRGHTHLDRGSFVLHALGHEWFQDLGPDNYGVGGGGNYDRFGAPSYEDGDRWKIYRLRAEGHNTLVINPRSYDGAGGDPDQRAGEEETNFIPIVERESLNTDSPFIVTNLTPVYSGRTPWQNISSVRRGLKMVNRSRVIVQDEIRASSGATVWWFAHAETKKSGASMTLGTDRTEATLSKDSSGKRLWCKLLSPSGAVFQKMAAKRLSTSPPGHANEALNATYEKLAIRLSGATAATIAVYMVPLAPGEAPPRATLPSVTPLANW